MALAAVLKFKPPAFEDEFVSPNARYVWELEPRGVHVREDKQPLYKNVVTWIRCLL